jgi:predicted RNA-binding protein with TRAM domain
LSDESESENLVVGKIYKAKVMEPKGPDGQPLARIDDYSVHVTGLALGLIEKLEKGEDIRVKVTYVKGKDATAELVTNAADIF